LVIRELDDLIISSPDNNVSIDNSTQLTPISFDKRFNVFNTSIGCAPDSASASVDVDTKADATVSLGVIANGTLVPPNVTQFEVTVGMTANLSGTVNLLADITVRTPHRGFGYFFGDAEAHMWQFLF
jgi:hypothetical protein